MMKSQINLPVKFQEKAKNELGECEVVRANSLRELREWIKTGSNIQECRQGKLNLIWIHM